MGFGLLATVPPALEVIEHAWGWRPARRWSDPSNLRTAFEEGGEILGILILLRACAWGRRLGVGSLAPARTTIGAPDVTVLRRPLLQFGWVLLIAVTLASAVLPPPMAPEVWLTSALFLVAAIASLSTGEPRAGTWGVAAVGLAGSIAGTVSSSTPGAYTWLHAGATWVGISASVVIVWLYEGRCRSEVPGRWFPVAALLLGFLPSFAALDPSGVLAPLAPQLLALLTLCLTPARTASSLRPSHPDPP